MLKIYTSPTSAFTHLRERPTWLVPLLLAVVANMAVVVVTTQYFDWNEQRQLAIERMQERNMTEEQVNQALEQMDRFGSSPLMRYGLPIAGSLITTVISLLVLALVYNVSIPLLGATGNFGRMLAVLAHSGLVAIPAAIVRIILVLVKKSADVSTSLLVLVPNVKSGFLAIILSRVDIFAIWQLVLAGLGVKILFDTKGTRSWWLVFSVWGVLTLALALLGGRQAPVGR